MKVLTTDDALQVYQARDLKSGEITRLPGGVDIQLGEITVLEGRQWIEVALTSGATGYALGPSVRGHTTFGAIEAQAPLSPVDQALKEIVAQQHSPRHKTGGNASRASAGGLIGVAAAWWFLRTNGREMSGSGWFIVVIGAIVAGVVASSLWPSGSDRQK